MPVCSAGGDQPLTVRPYSIGTLCEFFACCAGAARRTVDRKLHRLYFEEYFKHLGVKTIVVEHSYTDRHFLEDYAGYYVRCFGKEHSKYKSRCSRLHFFQIAFGQNDFRDAILGHSHELTVHVLNENYIGFIIVKPLPKTFVGRTCLRVYEGENRRHYPVTRSHEAHLAGLRLTVESLAFQEQDRVAAACATSALWSLFQKTGPLFEHHVPSPLEITHMATLVRAGGFGRDVPSSGLTTVQMAGAIKKVNLEPELVNIQPETPDDQPDLGSVAGEASLQAVCYAYLKAAIPVMLNAALYDISNPVIETHGEPRFLGGHAVTVTGYSTGRPSCTPFGEVGTLFTSSRVDKLYVHDDQVGPFARLTLGQPALRFPKTNRRPKIPVLKSSWHGEDNVPGSVVFAAETLILPLYHKIRIPAIAIRQRVVQIDDDFEKAREATPDILTERLEWDVFLTTENAFKEDIRRSTSLAADEQYTILEDALPRFVWRAIALHAGQRVLEILYDATDIEQGNYTLRPIVYDRERVNALFA